MGTRACLNSSLCDFFKAFIFYCIIYLFRFICFISGYIQSFYGCVADTLKQGKHLILLFLYLSFLDPGIVASAACISALREPK